MNPGLVEREKKCPESGPAASDDPAHGTTTKSDCMGALTTSKGVSWPDVAINGRTEFALLDREVSRLPSGLFVVCEPSGRGERAVEWASTFGGITAIRPTGPLSLFTRTNLFYSPWAIRAGYLHGADCLPAFEQAVHQIPGGAAIRSIDLLQFHRPVSTNLDLYCSRIEPNVFTDPRAKDRLAVSASVTLANGNRCYLKGYLNGDPITRRDHRNPLFRHLVPYHSKISRRQDGEATIFSYPCDGSSLFQFRDAITPGLFASALIDVMNWGMMHARGIILPHSPSVLMDTLERLTVPEVNEFATSVSNVCMSVAGSPSCGGRFNKFNLEFDFTDPSSRVVFKSYSALAMPSNPEIYGAFVDKVRERTRKLVDGP